MRNRMGQFEFICPEGDLALAGTGVVTLVKTERCAPGGKLHADLMASSGFQMNPDKRLSVL